MTTTVPGAPASSPSAIADNGVPPAVYQGGTIGDMILAAIDRFPERVAFIDDGRQWTYRQLGLRIGHAIDAFRALGLRRGDGVVQLSPNRVEMFVVMAAAYLSGMRSVTLHGMGGLDDHAYIVDDAQASVFIADPAYAERAMALRARCPQVRHWFCHERMPPDDAALPDFWRYAERAEHVPLAQAALPTDIVRLAYTGGTTGKPKGVMLSNRSMWMQAVLLLAARSLPDDVRLLCPTPISHGAGAMVVPTLWRGGTVILQRGFDAERFIDALERHRANLAFLVPTMIYTLLDHPRSRTADFSSLRTLSYGAAPMSPARIREALARFGPVLAQSYGQTECPSNILQLTQEDHCRGDGETLTSAGMPYPGVTVALLDDDDRPVERGTVGELCVRSPLVMDGYWKQPEQTAQVLRNGWLHTGDMAYQDPLGYFHLVDRKKDMIVSGGFNVYPREVEDVLTAHPAVAAAAVIGVPDDKWGEAVKAVVVLRAGAQASDEELRAVVRIAKGAVNTPKSIDFVAELPLTTLGKPDKKRLRERYWQGHARAVH
ncbi:AMP-binding protein [Cupriavidus gilardii]|uniref:AMP-binding protein n=1 Tax=Cupriavidus gilardii TaxID=82541 RepID=UPI0021BF4FCC|nr:AMP-binding protein [Cupriavidus gilardii]MCT9118501.1 AMP-binding protein [Cupriavidus gilardii]